MIEVSDRKGSYIIMPMHRIMWLESLRHHTVIHLEDHEITVTENFSVIEKKLDDIFLRLHRSYIVSVPIYRKDKISFLDHC